MWSRCFCTHWHAKDLACYRCGCTIYQRDDGTDGPKTMTGLGQTQFPYINGKYNLRYNPNSDGGIPR